MIRRHVLGGLVPFIVFFVGHHKNDDFFSHSHFIGWEQAIIGIFTTQGISSSCCHLKNKTLLAKMFPVYSVYLK